MIEELTALAARQLTRSEFFFWRTQAEAEVDLLDLGLKRGLRGFYDSGETPDEPHNRGRAVV